MDEQRRIGQHLLQQFAATAAANSDVPKPVPKHARHPDSGVERHCGTSDVLGQYDSKHPGYCECNGQFHLEYANHVRQWQFAFQSPAKLGELEQGLEQSNWRGTAAVGGATGSGYGGGISGTINPVTPFQTSMGANGSGHGAPSVTIAAGQFGKSGSLGSGGGGGTGSYAPAPSPSASSDIGQGQKTAAANFFGETQAPGFVDPRFDPRMGQFASPGQGGANGGRQASNETGGQSANPFDARSAQQRFEADYKRQPGSVSDKLNDFSKRLQYAADRRKPHWVNDGHVGHAPGLRMGLDS